MRSFNYENLDGKYYLFSFFIEKIRTLIYLENIFNSPSRVKNENLITLIRFKKMEDFKKKYNYYNI